jgi:hypothetical protein
MFTFSYSILIVPVETEFDDFRLIRTVLFDRLEFDSKMSPFAIVKFLIKTPAYISNKWLGVKVIHCWLRHNSEVILDSM